MTAPPLTQPVDRKRYRSSTLLTMGATSTELPPGVCGQVEGVAMVYGVIDSWGTTFLKGCLDRTVRERVAARKVKLYFDHGDVVLSGMYDTHLHIGTVTDVWDAVTEDGHACSMFRADIFDTAPGRTAHEYLTAIAQTRSETGVSIGMMDEPKTVRAVIAGVSCDQVTEAALREISVTGESSVPGTRVTSVRQEMPGPKVTDLGPATATHERLITHDGRRFKIAIRGVPLLATPEIEVETIALVSDLIPDLTPPNYFAILDGLIAHLGVDQVRAHLGTTVSNADGVTSDAASGAPASSDSDASSLSDSPGVSRDGTEPPAPNVVPMTERVAFLRRTYAEGYSP